VLKRLRYDMVAGDIAAAVPIPSYLVECLVWNVPDTAFESESYADNLRAVLVHLYQNTQRDEMCSEWREVNEVKYLLRPTQPWTRAAVSAFVVAAWNRAGF